LKQYSNRDNIGELFVLHGVLKSTLNRFSVFAIDIYYFSPVWVLWIFATSVTAQNSWLRNI